MVKTLVILAGVATAGALALKSMQSAQKDAQAKGTSDPNYVPTPNIWAADQKASMGENTWCRRAAECTPLLVWNPFGADKPDIIQRSGETLPAKVTVPSGAPVSPYFWRADAVPINARLPGSDADPSLAVNWCKL
jgi:hypothetical protein